MDSRPSEDYFTDFEQNLRSLLFELNGKRVQVSEYQREVSGLLLRNHDLERQLETERRSCQGVQLQLDLTMKASHRGDAERDTLVQKASRNELQLALAQQEIAILRAECQKLELKLMKINQENTQQSEQMHHLTLFKESCVGLQARVKTALSVVSNETDLLRSELQRLSNSQQSVNKHSINFVVALQHFTCLETRQAKERELTSTQMAALKAKVNELSEKRIETNVRSSTSDLSSELLKEYESSIKVMEGRLSSERETTRKLAITLSEAVNAQQSLQQIETNLRERITVLETKVNACTMSEEQLKKQLEEARTALLQSSYTGRSKKEQSCVETQTSPRQSSPTLPVLSSKPSEVERVTHYEEFQTSQTVKCEVDATSRVIDLT